MSCYCDYDMPSFYLRDVRRARKSHKCYECSGVIAVGEKYEHVSAKYDWVTSFKTCQRCVDLRTWVANNLPCFCWAHGNLLEDGRDAVDAADWRAGEEVKGIRFGFARRVLTIRKHNAAARLAA
jgi:hypothetical protein